MKISELSDETGVTYGSEGSGEQESNAQTDANIPAANGMNEANSNIEQNLEQFSAEKAYYGMVSSTDGPGGPGGTGGTGGTGGPGETSETSETSETGRTDGPGGTGGTGGPGGTGETGEIGAYGTADGSKSLLSSENQPTYGPTGPTGYPEALLGIKDEYSVMNRVLDAHVSVSDFAHDLMMREFHGHTGGIGGIPESFKEVKIQTPPVKMKQTMEAIIKNMSEDELLVELGKQNTKINSFVGKANAGGAVLAIRMGMIINQLKIMRATMDDWGPWSKKHIIDVYKVSKRSLEKYSNIHLLPNVEQHTQFGIELLAEFGSIYKRSDFETRKLMGDDPIKHYVDKLKADSSAEERNAHIEAVIEVLKLERYKVNIDLELMKSFLAVDGKLSKDRRKFLASGQETNPEFASEFLNRVIAHNGNWAKAEEEITPKGKVESLAASQDNTKPESPTKDIPNIVVQATSLRQTIEAMLRSNKIANDVSAEMLDELMTAINALKSRITPQESAA